MFETSTDIFYIVASGCLALLTIFLCSALYHLIAILSRAHRLVDVIEGFLEKAGRLSSYFSAIGGAAQIIKNRFSGDSEEDEDELEVRPRSRKKRK